MKQKRARRGDLFESIGCRFHSRDLCRVIRRPDNNEVVIHHIVPDHVKAFLHCLQLLLLGMDKDEVRIAPLSNLDRRAGAYSNNVHFDSGLLLEDRQDVVEQS